MAKPRKLCAHDQSHLAISTINTALSGLLYCNDSFAGGGWYLSAQRIIAEI
jgi:hypothetical protein